MYALLLHPDQVLPTVMSRSDLRFPEFIMLGYEAKYEGTRQQCEAQQEKMIANVVSGMDEDFWAISL